MMKIVSAQLVLKPSIGLSSPPKDQDSICPMVFNVDTAYIYEATGLQKLARPRIHLGTSIGTSGSATQVFTGFSWTADFSEKVFAEAGFGGVIHTGELDENDDGPALGCRVLFHEYIGAGYRFDNHWNVMAQVAHSSHANLCDGPNNGMTRAGLQLGYKF